MYEDHSLVVCSGFDDILEMLILTGANINARQKNGSTALMIACEEVSMDSDTEIILNETCYDNCYIILYTTNVYLKN